MVGGFDRTLPLRLRLLVVLLGSGLLAAAIGRPGDSPVGGLAAHDVMRPGFAVPEVVGPALRSATDSVPSLAAARDESRLGEDLAFLSGVGEARRPQAQGASRRLSPVRRAQRPAVPVDLRDDPAAAPRGAARRLGGPPGRMVDGISRACLSIPLRI